MHQMEIICLDQVVGANHRYRRFIELWDFKSVDAALLRIRSDNPHEGYGITKLFRCLLLQFLEDLSDRELEVFLQENMAGKWFCGFSLSEATPDHTVFTRARKRVGTALLSELFEQLRSQLKKQGYMNEVFTFVDASHLIAKANLWQERDEAIKQRYEKLNNEVLPKVAHDKQARIGCKGKHQYWYGYKKHASIDMQSGLINKVAVTAANVTDARGFKHVCPSQGAVYADKGYCVAPAKQIAARKGCHLAAIKKNNMKDKNADKDRWYTKMRAPYERVFSHDPKRVRYKGIAKNQFAIFMQAICFNLKRLLALSPPAYSLNTG
jgi:transposase, IS5 family